MQERTYGGWQPERSGFVGRLSLGGFVFASVGVSALLVPLYARTWASLLVGGPVSAVFFALAWVPVAGMSAGGWLMLSARHTWAVARRRHQFASGVFAPWRPRPAGDPPDALGSGAGPPLVEQPGRVAGRSILLPAQHQPMDLPGVLACLRILEAPTGTGQQAAIVHSPAERTYTAVIPLAHAGFALIDTARQQQRLDGWAGLLASLCTEAQPILRLGVVVRALPDDGTALSRWTVDHLHPTAPAAAVITLGELLGQAGPTAVARETYLSLTLSAARARTAVKAAGGGDAGAAAVLIQQVAGLRTLLASADLDAGPPLGIAQLAAVIRCGFDPLAVGELAAGPHPATGQPLQAGSGQRTTGPPGTDPSKTGTMTGRPDPAGGTPAAPALDPELAGPAAASNSWMVYRHDGAWTVTFQVRWPRQEVYPAVLAPLMRPRPGVRRSVALVCEPLGPRRAERELSIERTKGVTRIWLRRRTGRLDREDDRLELERARAQDRARAAGHGLIRFVGLVAVTVTRLEDLDTAVAELIADAHGAHLDLRRLAGAQDAGFAAAVLPLGLGLPIRRTAL